MKLHFFPILLGSLLAACAASRTNLSPELVADEARPVPASAAPQASYGPRADDWEFTLGGSGANDNDFDTGSFATSASLGRFLTDRSVLGVRQSLNYADFGNSTWNGATRVFYDYHFSSGALRPLVGANLGWVYGDSVDETIAAAPEAGIQWYATDTAFLFALIEYQFFFEDAEDADDTFDDGSFVYTIGIGLRK